MRAPPRAGSRVPLGMPRRPLLAAPRHSGLQTPGVLRTVETSRWASWRERSHRTGCLLLQAAHRPCLVCPCPPVVWDPAPPPSSWIICVRAETPCWWPAPHIACSQAAHFSQLRFSASFAAELSPLANMSHTCWGGRVGAHHHLHHPGGPWSPSHSPGTHQPVPCAHTDSSPSPAQPGLVPGAFL